MTCDPSGANAAHCDHLLSGDPVNKIIRLPESCGAGPFARVASWSNSTATKRNGLLVHVCSFDYHFTNIPDSYVPCYMFLHVSARIADTLPTAGRTKSRFPFTDPLFLECCTIRPFPPL